MPEMDGPLPRIFPPKIAKQHVGGRLCHLLKGTSMLVREKLHDLVSSLDVFCNSAIEK